MKETGIPVYDCKSEKKGVNEIYVKKDLLVPEDSEKRKVDEAKAVP
jgi:hypothetical protein